MTDLTENTQEAIERAGFTHLHLHSEYSLLDGGNRIGDLVDKVAELGMDAVALTDHGNMFGAVSFYRACTKKGIKPILGIEAYVAPDVVREQSDRRFKETQGVSDGGFHLVLLAENQTGYQNLLKLTSDSYIEGFYYKPRMDKETLTAWGEGLIAINGHLGSSIAYWLRQYVEKGEDHYYERALAEARWHAELFGPNEKGEPRFFLELQRHGTREQDEINPHLARMSEELSLPLVCDNDAHFLRAEDWDTHDTLVCVSTGKLKDDAERLRYPRDLWVKGPQAMAEIFKDHPEALINTRRIADRCNVELDFETNHAPVVGIERLDPPAPIEEAPRGSPEWHRRFSSTYRLVPVDSTTAGELTHEEREERCDAALRELAEAGLVWRYGDEGVTEAHRQRLERELGVLSSKHISAYFLIVWDFVNEARNRGIPAMARGSGVGTMVGYCLGLSNACPVQYGLLFERFTDPDRSEYPDIDIDLCQDGRAEILDYVREKYGYVAQIITFGTMKARAAVRDVGRVLNLPLPDVDKICKLIGDQLGITIQDALGQEPELESLCRDPHVKSVIDTAQALEGITRHSGVHAAGVVLATQPLDNLVPLAISKQGTKKSDKKNRDSGPKDILVTQWDGPTVESMGLLKMDFLGLKTLSVVERARALVRETLSEEQVQRALGHTVPLPPNAPDPLDLDRIDFTDPKVLDLYRRGETVGTFQFESDGMRSLLLKMRPDRLEDLVAGNALYRPGPMALIDDYCKRKNGEARVPKVHEIVDRFTEDTYGIMVYQEQVMQIAHELGGIPLREAYSLIKAISKKKHETINAARARFLDGAETRGLARRKAAELFELILKFAGYGFNKSHSVGYSILAFQTAFLKTYFPVQFMAAVLTFESDNTDKLVTYLDECKRVLLPNGERGTLVKPPDVNTSRHRFQVVYEDGEEVTPSAGHIRFGLDAIKGVGAKAVEATLEARESGGPFQSIFDFVERVPPSLVNKSTVEALMKAGAFDSIHGEEMRSTLFAALERVVKHGQRAAADRDSGQSSLFGGAANETSEEAVAELPQVEPWSSAEQLQHEKAALGFFASKHPLDEHEDVLENFSSANLAQAQELPGKSEIIVGAMITNLRVVRTRSGRNPGQKMAMLTIEDHHGKMDAVVFSEAYLALEHVLKEDAILFWKGTVDRRREEPNLLVEKVVTLEDAPSQFCSRVRICLEDAGLQPPEATRGAANEATEEPEGASMKDELMKLRELLDDEKKRINGSAAEVVFEIRLGGRVVHHRPSGLRVPVDPGLPGRVDELLGRDGACSLHGPERVQGGPARTLAPPPVETDPAWTYPGQ